jgi:hypothetical protein
VGPTAGLDAEVRGKILCLCRGSNAGLPVYGRTLHWLSYPKNENKYLKEVNEKITFFG